MSSGVAYLVYVKEGKYGDSVPAVIRSTSQKARQWCEQHRKLARVREPVEWDGDPICETGTTGDFTYVVEPFPYE